MKKTELTTTLSRTVNKVGLQMKKRSPEILVVVGVVGTVASAVMACKATLKVEEIMAGSNEDVEKIHEVRALDGQPNPRKPETIIEYSEDDERSDLAKVYIQTGLKLAKLYAPSVILGALSITSIIASHNIIGECREPFAFLSFPNQHHLKHSNLHLPLVTIAVKYLSRFSPGP